MKVKWKKIYYKSVIIHKNRIFPYFQNKVKKSKQRNIIITAMIMIILIIRRKIIINQWTWIKRKDVYCY